MKHKNAVVIFAKAPDKSTVKTRLIGHMTDDERVDLYVSLLENTVKQLRDLPETDAFIAYTPKSGRACFTKFGLRLFPQSDGDIGARMFDALNKVLSMNYEKAALVGVDIPGISAETVSDAFQLLEKTDIVFGPTIDGGYYMVALKKPVREIFEGVQWVHESDP